MPQRTSVEAPARSTEDDGPTYDATFWITYAANLAVMVAMSLLFRYADFVRYLGGTELQLGWIVGLGMVGSLVMRLAQGVGIDIYGSRRIWLFSSAGFALACAGHLAITRIDSPAIYVLRVMFNTSLAGVFGASITHIARRAPLASMAEVVGMLGTSGFIGMVLGSSLGDWLLGGEQSRWMLNRMFLVASGLGVCSLVLGWFATRHEVRPQRRKQLPLWHTLRRFHPGTILAVGVAMGVGIGLPHTFLRPYTHELGIHRIGLFFGIYAPTAFLTRFLTRRMPEKVGIRPMIYAGLGCLAASMLLYLPVRAEWQLAMPAICQGIAHALLFPAVVAGGSSAFPVRYRGIGTTLMLATFDLGNLIGAPSVGGILHVAREAGWPPWTTMFTTVSAGIAAVLLWYALKPTYRYGERRGPRQRRRKPMSQVPATAELA